MPIAWVFHQAKHQINYSAFFCHFCVSISLQPIWLDVHRELLDSWPTPQRPIHRPNQSNPHWATAKRFFSRHQLNNSQNGWFHWYEPRRYHQEGKGFWRGLQKRRPIWKARRWWSQSRPKVRHRSKMHHHFESHWKWTRFSCLLNRQTNFRRTFQRPSRGVRNTNRTPYQRGNIDGTWTHDLV